jgi:hypothetical protein
MSSSLSESFGNTVSERGSFLPTCRKPILTPAFHRRNLSHFPNDYYSTNISWSARNKGLCALRQSSDGWKSPERTYIHHLPLLTHGPYIWFLVSRFEFALNFMSSYFFFFLKFTNNYIYGPEHYSRVHQLWGYQHFMEPEGSLPHSQELSTCSYPVPDQSSPYHPILPLQYPSTHPSLDLPSGLFQTAFPTNNLYAFFFFFFSSSSSSPIRATCTAHPSSSTSLF